MILEASHLEFAYRRDTVLAGVDVRIGPGLTAIVGPNAAGKSTLLRCLCGLLRPRGQVRLDSRQLSSFKQDELAWLVSYLPQDLSTTAVLTVFEAVLLGRLHQLRWRVDRQDIQAVDRLLAELRLTELAGRYVSELSGGQLQMVAIAQALAREPAVLLMDEPTANLDLRHQWEICTLIRDLTAQRGMSTAMAMHDLNLAAKFADTVYVLQDGRVAASGPPADVLTETLVASVYRVAVRVSPGEDGRPVISTLGLTRKSQ